MCEKSVRCCSRRVKSSLKLQSVTEKILSASLLRAPCGMHNFIEYEFFHR
jgi:hypothetical protein